MLAARTSSEQARKPTAFRLSSHLGRETWVTSTDALGFPGGASGKGSICQCRRHKRHRSGRPPGGGHGHPLQYSCLENPMDRGAWWATIHGVTKSGTRLSTHCTSGHPEGQGGSSLRVRPPASGSVGAVTPDQFLTHPGSQLNWMVCKDGEIWGPLSC